MNRLAAIWILTLTLAGQAAANVIVINPSASIAAEPDSVKPGPSEAPSRMVPVLRLADIAKLEGDYAESLANVEIGPVRPSLRMSDIRDALDRHGVNWARLTLRGSLTVTLNDTPPKPAQSAAPSRIASPSDLAAATANPHGLLEVTTDAPAAPTLGQRLVDHLAARLGVPIADLKIAFEPADAALLGETTLKHRFEIDPITGDGVGRVPVTVRRYDGAILLATHHVVADVQVRRSVVVVRRSVSRGQVITDADVELKTLWIDSLIKEPLDDLACVVGMRAAGILRVGSHVHADDIRSLELVKRGQIVTVRAVSGGLVVKTVARAMGDGAAGEVIVVRNERTREQFNVRVTGPQEATVMLDAPGPVAVKEEAR